MFRDRRSWRTSTGRILHRGSDNGEIQVRNRAASRCACPVSSHLQFPLTFGCPRVAEVAAHLLPTQAITRDPRRHDDPSSIPRSCHRDHGADGEGGATSGNKRIETATKRRGLEGETLFLAAARWKKGKARERRVVCRVAALVRYDPADHRLLAPMLQRSIT